MNKKNEIKISIILAAYKRPDLLKKALIAIAQQTYSKKKFELVIVDDSGTQLNKKLVESFQKKFQVQYFSDNHQGTAKARSKAFQNANGEIFAFMDEDTIPEKEWLESIEKEFDSHPKAVGIEGKILTTPTRYIFSHVPRTGGAGNYIGCNTHYRKKVVLMQNGGYWPEFFFYREDTSLAFKALEKGPIVFSENIKLFHPPKEIKPFSFISNLRFIKEDFLLLRRYPRKTINFFWNQWVGFNFHALLAYTMLLLGLWFTIKINIFLGLSFPFFFYGIYRSSLSLQNRTFTQKEFIHFLAVSYLRDLLYPLVWIRYFIGVIILKKPALGEWRDKQ